MDRPRIRALYGIARNGLPWRTGIVILSVVNLARQTQQGPAAGTWTDFFLWKCAHRLRDPRFGGSNGPAIDPTFQVAAGMLIAKPGPGLLS